MKKIVVVDLDGCLCTINSFRFWMFFSLLFLLFSLHWVRCYKFNAYIVLRVIGKSDRVRMKRDILSVTEDMPFFVIKLFCRFLYQFINHNVLSEVRKYKKLHVPVVLSTAAPACYVDVFAEKLGFSHVFSTQSVFGISWKENIGNEKWESISAYYGKEVIVDCVITDHHDDLPLLMRAKKRILVRPSKVTLDKISGLFDFDVL